MKAILTATLLSLGTLLAADEVQITTAARNVLIRTMGADAVERIQLETLPKKDGRDVYSYASTRDTLTVRGSSAVALCRGTYDYLRANNMGTIGWAGARLRIPAKWPAVSPAEGETPFKIRHCYNAVTSGYTTAYWTWERWEQELDWLAMHGYNMIMAPVATEAIADRVWKRLGLTQKELDEYYVGPAHLPWQRMGCIRQVGGTLGESWHTDQIALQHKLLKRMRVLGIEPVVQGFSGFVPPAIKRIHPDIVLHPTHWNGGFPVSQRPVVMLPDDPVFARITKDYLTEWQKEFGTARYILVDSFNEMKLPETDRPVTEMLANYGKKTYEAITAAMPDAVWTLQGWMFNYQRYIWNQDTVKALMAAVPDDRLLVLDYANDYNPNWDDFSAFHGKTWVMGYVPNMGGKTAYTGKMDFYANQVARTLDAPRHGNLVGFTISGEGLENNEVLYELMSDTAWSREAVDLDTWLPKYAANRYASADPVLAEAWQALHKSVYSSFTPHPTFDWQKKKLGHGSAYRDMRFVHAIQTYLSVAKAHESDANYRDDAVEMAALALGIRAQEWFALVPKAMSNNSKDIAEKAARRGIELLLEADKLLQSHSLHRLDRWIALARAHDGTAAEKDFYENNARHIITVWGPPVDDYACRVWAGLIRDYYVPRMKMTLEGIIAGKTSDIRAWEMNWLKSQGVSRVEPFKHPARSAAELVEIAFAEDLPTIEIAKVDGFANWTPKLVKRDWTTVEWDFPVEKLKTFKGVRFHYTHGNHLLEIQSAAIIADGHQVAIDKHNGTTGDVHRNNFYKLKVPENIRANNSCVLRAVIRGSSGTNSNGQVLVVE